MEGQVITHQLILLCLVDFASYILFHLGFNVCFLLCTLALAVSCDYFASSICVLLT